MKCQQKHKNFFICKKQWQYFDDYNMQKKKTLNNFFNVEFRKGKLLFLLLF